MQLLIERGCSFAVKNSAGFTAADFAYTHSVKAALEAFGRAQYDNRKRQRRAATNTASNSTEGSTGLAGPQGALGTRQSSNNLFAVAQGMPLPGTPTREQVPLPTTPQTPSWTTQGGHALHGTYTPANATQQQQLHRHYEGSESSASYASSSFEGRLRSGSGTSSAAEGSGRDWDPIKTFAQPGQPVPSPSPRPMANSQQVRNVFAEDGRRPSMGLPYRKAPSFDEAPWPGPGGTRSPPARPTQALPADTFGTSMSTSTSELSSIASKVRLRDQAAMNLFNRSRSPAPAPVPSPGPPASAGPPQASAGAYAVPTSAGPLKTAFFQNPQSQLSPPDGHGQGTHATPAHSRSLSAGAVVSSPTGAKLPPPPRTPPAHSNGSSALHSPGGSPKPPTPPPKS